MKASELQEGQFGRLVEPGIGNHIVRRLKTEVRGFTWKGEMTSYPVDQRRKVEPINNVVISTEAEPGWYTIRECFGSPGWNIGKIVQVTDRGLYGDTRLVSVYLLQPVSVVASNDMPIDAVGIVRRADNPYDRDKIDHMVRKLPDGLLEVLDPTYKLPLKNLYYVELLPENNMLHEGQFGRVSGKIVRKLNGLIWSLDYRGETEQAINPKGIEPFDNAVLSNEAAPGKYIVRASLDSPGLYEGNVVEVKPEGLYVGTKELVSRYLLEPVSKPVNLPYIDLNEEWREYNFPGRDPYRIYNPERVYIGKTTHRVVANGVVHCVPAPGHCGCVLTWKGEVVQAELETL